MTFRNLTNSGIGLPVWFLLLATLFVAGCGIAREKPYVEAKEEKPKQTGSRGLVKLDPGAYMQTWAMEDGRVISFSVSIPENYTGDRPTPIVLALHYGAERVTQFFGNQMLHAMVKPAVAELQPIIVAPDVINRSWVNFRCEESVMALMNEMCNTYNIDRSRILVLGYSLGAQGAWHYAGKYPDFFTAAIPIAGHPPDDYIDTSWSVPMLVVHSKSDEVFPFKVVNEAVQQLQARGDQIQMYPLDGISHYESGKFVTPLKEAANWVKEVWEANPDHANPK